MAKRGRKSKLTPDTQKAICDGIRGGLTYEQAAIFAGVSESAFHDWKSKGEKAKSGKFKEFSEAIKRANVEARAVHIQRITNASKGGATVTEETIVEKIETDAKTGVGMVTFKEKRTTTKKALPVWQASAWILERRFPNEFGRHIQPQAPDSKDPMDEWLEALDEAENEYA